MDINNRIIKHFKDSAELKLRVKDSLAKPIAEGAQVFFDCVTNDGKILCCGNGGSAADAQHFAAELLNRFEKERPGMECVALTTDSSVLTSIGNDYDFNQIFSKQVRALGLPGDSLKSRPPGSMNRGSSERLPTPRSAQESQSAVLLKKSL